MDRITGKQGPAAVLLFVCLVVTWCRVPAAEQVPPLALAKHFYHGGYYEQALTEYTRARFLAADRKEARQAAWGMIRCHAACGRVEQVITHLSSLYESARDRGERQTAGIALGRYCMERNYHNLARHYLRQLPASGGTADDTVLALYHLGWNAFMAKEWHRADSLFSRLADGPYPDVWTRAAERAGRELARRGTIPRKSPALAGWLSFFVPGGGQLYAERPWQAAGSLLINGGFAALAWRALREEEWVTAGVIYLLGWYRYHVGGAWGAAGLAKEFNRRQEAAWVERVRQKEYKGMQTPGSRHAASKRLYRD